MSEHLRKIHNYSKPPQAQPTTYPQPNNATGSYSRDGLSTPNNDISFTNSTRQNGMQQIYQQINNSPGSHWTNNEYSVTNSIQQNGVQQNASCMYSQNEAVNHNMIDFATWREKASVDDWKAFLLASPSPPANIQTPRMQRQPTNHFGLNANSIHNRIAQQHPTAYTSYSYAFNGGFRPVFGHETKRTSGAIDNRRAFMEKLRVNNIAVKDWFQNRLLENRMKSEYNYYPPGLLERIRLEKERLRTGLAHVETLMNNPNEYGYVMLDDRAINVLVTIIDRILPKDLDLEMLRRQTYQY